MHGDGIMHGDGEAHNIEMRGDTETRRLSRTDIVRQGNRCTEIETYGNR